MLRSSPLAVPRYLGRTVLGLLWTGRWATTAWLCNANYPMDGTFRCRIIHGKKARTTSAGLGQLPTWEEENCEEATAYGWFGLTRR